MRCKSCGHGRSSPGYFIPGPGKELICGRCAEMLVGAKVFAEIYYGRPFFWDGKSPVRREDFLHDSIGRAWELHQQGVRFPGLLSFIQAQVLGGKNPRS